MKDEKIKFQEVQAANEVNQDRRALANAVVEAAYSRIKMAFRGEMSLRSPPRSPKKGSPQEKRTSPDGRGDKRE